MSAILRRVRLRWWYVTDGIYYSRISPLTVRVVRGTFLGVHGELPVGFRVSDDLVYEYSPVLWEHHV